MSWLQTKGAFPLGPKQHFLQHLGVQAAGLTGRSHVYSFGVVLLQLLTGRRPVGNFGEEGLDIVQWTKLQKNCSNDKVVKILDERPCHIPLDEAKQVYFVAMLCVQEQSVERPTMREVVVMLAQAKKANTFQKHLPRKVADKLIGIQRSFLWGEGSEQRKIAWVKWETICLPKQKGGLGIKDIRTFNKALLGKWRWDLFHQSKELWARILASKYGG
ncbi:leucine-rich repeat receptor-like kinase protein THICK TASSEL DWARF1 [Glycine soja]|uniref:leucine-rich repeat receptor-like kinase protein THICK TASSEL DWARF1 n=1 Tax=Glycine soja TaxID=3848 RepID=UPI001039C392|nr:leucine-rich repeat receptor-like kinase protein THICK TASSEL DWARF1 [Glycine soja]